jgi:hypothetical protein
MDAKTIQAWLNAEQKSKLAVDGVVGRKTLAAVDEVLSREAGRGWRQWPDARRLVAIEQLIYAKAGIEVGRIDGLVGPQTLYAREVSTTGVTATNWRDSIEADAPAQPITKWPKQRDVEAYYGKPGAWLSKVILPYPMVLAWDRSVRVSSFSAHERVVPAIERVFDQAKTFYSATGVIDLRLNLFGGCFNIRKMRGGSALSMHSWGIAVDIDPERNQLRWGRDLASLDDPVYDKWWSFWEAEGGVSLGRMRNYDWMHVQFARL